MRRMSKSDHFCKNEAMRAWTESQKVVSMGWAGWLGWAGWAGWLAGWLVELAWSSIV